MIASSMREYTTDRACREQFPRHPAEDEFAETAAAVAAGHDQIRALLLGRADELAGAAGLRLRFDLGRDFDLVACEIIGGVLDVRPGIELPPHLGDVHREHRLCH